MLIDKGSTPVAAQQSGTLCMSDGCPALMRVDGRRYWLEMEHIPQDLIDQPVDVEGMFYQKNLIVVDRIGPSRSAQTRIS